MRKRALCLITGFVLSAMLLAYSGAGVYAFSGPSSDNRTTLLSRVDLKRYFEKAMALFESAKYKEAIMVFENLIEIEKSQNEYAFTPFAEIYIDKSRSRMEEIYLVEDKRWDRMKEDLISEAEVIAREEEKAFQEELRSKEFHEEEMRRKAIEEARAREERARDAKVMTAYERAFEYYKSGNYPSSIVEFKKIREIDPEHRLVSQAQSYIEKAQAQIKLQEENELLARMEAARQARLEMENERKRIEMAKEKERIEGERREREKERLREVFERRLKQKEREERIAKIKDYIDTIKAYVRDDRFEDAEKKLSNAMAEFPENKRFKDVAHYVEMQKVKMESDALNKAREIVEEKMLLEIAKKHLIPEYAIGELPKEKSVTRIVKVPEIRKRLKIPISVDFKDLGLDYVLSFLSDATGVNIVPSSEIDMAEKKVTIKIKDMALEDALRYILKSQDLVYRIEEDAVWVATSEELENEKVETRVYFLNQGVGRFAEFTGSYSEESGTQASTEVKTVKDIIENSVEWPKDSRITMDDRTGALILSNTPSNLEIAENLLYSLDITPVQVVIEARFLEVKVTDTDELGVEWKLNSDWGASQNNAKGNRHGFASNSGVDFSSFSRGEEGFNLTYQGVLSHPQFQAVLHALNEKQNVKTLSAPRITTLNNQTATIEVTDEFIYPTRYEVSLVQFDINGDGDFDDAGETEWANIPQDFVTRDVGILLHVKPSVGVDNKTITLALTPEVSESAGDFTYSGDVTIPQFQTRNLSTSVIVDSGQTVVMGGLIKESKTNIVTKVPVLGDIPVVGRLFRKDTDSTERRNLLIFVTASVVNENESVMANAIDDNKGVHEQ